MYLHKNGIKFRKVEDHDLPKLLELKQESWWGTHGSPVLNTRDQEAWFNNLDDSKTLVMIAESKTHEVCEYTVPVGVGIFSNIDWIARTCDLSGSIYQEYRGQQLVKDAFECGLDFGFEILNMNRIQAEVVEYNLAAQKLEIEHLGFTVEGRRRQCVYKAGRYYDSIMLGILRDEWGVTKYKRSMVDGCNLNVDHSKCLKNASRAKDLGAVSP